MGNLRLVQPAAEHKSRYEEMCPMSIGLAGWKKIEKKHRTCIF